MDSIVWAWHFKTLALYSSTVGPKTKFCFLHSSRFHQRLGFKFIEDPKCPPVTPKTPAQCKGQRSNCWSPGVRDLDCPGSGLCCYDGCANTCVSDSPPPRAPPPTPKPRPPPPPPTTTRKPKPPPVSYIPLPPPEEVYQPPAPLYIPPPDTTPLPPPPPPAYNPPPVPEPSNEIEIRKFC